MLALTRLDLSNNDKLDGGWVHLLPLTLLQDLGLKQCYLTALPQQLSAMLALTAWTWMAIAVWMKRTSTWLVDGSICRRSHSCETYS
jgi:hypothetical protein